MRRDWLNELMNVLAGNSRYVTYTPQQKRLFVLSMLLFLLISYLFVDSYIDQ